MSRADNAASPTARSTPRRREDRRRACGRGNRVRTPKATRVRTATTGDQQAATAGRTTAVTAPGAGTAAAAAPSAAEPWRRRWRGRRNAGARAAAPAVPRGAKAAAGGATPARAGDPRGRDRHGAHPDGILDVLGEGYGFLRTSGYLPSQDDVYVSLSQIRRFALRKGDQVAGKIRTPRDNEKYYALLQIETVNGVDPDTARQRREFDKLTPLFPDERFRLEGDPRTSRSASSTWWLPSGRDSAAWSSRRRRPGRPRC